MTFTYVLPMWSLKWMKRISRIKVKHLLKVGEISISLGVFLSNFPYTSKSYKNVTTEFVQVIQKN